MESGAIEALKLDILQQFLSSVEPILRKIVREEVECAFAVLGPSGLGARTPQRQIQDTPVLDLHLAFLNRLSVPLFTGGRVEGEGGLPVCIAVKDGTTRQIIDSGPISSAKLEIVVLEGDFTDKDEEWTAEDFENHVIRERDGKRPLLTGDLNVTLKEGVGTLGELTFTDNSSWVKSKKFRLGARIVPRICEGIRVKECITEAFTVKEHKGEPYKKHYPPQLLDEVWRLDKIRKDGPFHKRLQQNNINTVEDFLRCYMVDQQKLRHTLGIGPSNKMWDATVEHAKTCPLNGKLYVYYMDSSQNVGVFFNNVYELVGVTSNNTYKSAGSLSEREKVFVDRLVKIAYNNWSRVTEYENALVIETVNKHVPSHIDDASREQTAICNQFVNFPQQQAHLQDMSTPASIAANSMGPQFYGYGADFSSRYANQGNQITPIISLPGSCPQSSGPTNTGVALALSQPSLSRSFGGYSSPDFQQVLQGSAVAWQCHPAHSPTTLDDISEDLQAQTSQILLDAEGILLLDEDAEITGFASSPAMTYVDDRVLSSGKAYIGWLRIKAALRWGTFIRKIAAEKASQRAQLKEIGDSHLAVSG